MISRAQQLRTFFHSGGSGTDVELASMFNTDPYVIRGYVSTMNQKRPGLIKKRSVAGQRKQEYFQPSVHRDIPTRKPVRKAAPILNITINGVAYCAIPLE